MNLKDYIRDIPNFPIEGVIFKDITPLLKDIKAFDYCINEVCKLLAPLDFDTIVIPEARGFIFGTAVASKMNKSIIPVRKPGKLPYKTLSESYDLEYGSATLEIHTDAFDKTKKVVVIDDVLATGGTSLAIAKLIEKAGGEVISIFNLINLSFLDGSKKLKSYKLLSLIEY